MSGGLFYDGLELSPLASSLQLPRYVAPGRSPLARVKTTVNGVQRGWAPNEAQGLPCQTRPNERKETTPTTTPTTVPVSICKPDGLSTTSSAVGTTDAQSAGGEDR